MNEETLVVKTVINAPAEAVFDLLADPTSHPAIDGTGWLRQPVDNKPLTAAGQIFRMGMYHDGHPNKHYEMANRVEEFNRPRTIAWQPGSEPRHVPGNPGPDDGPIEFGGWIWRYDLEPADAGRTEVTLTYDWSQVPPDRRGIGFPPFPHEHLDNSLKHLAELAELAERGSAVESTSAVR
ncbi:polyketide cyclase [Mycobacterium sp. 1100029.7]|nr:polyketide cyclase [Mycobacterium sp. 1100029.7]